MKTILQLSLIVSLLMLVSPAKAQKLNCVEAETSMGGGSTVFLRSVGRLKSLNVEVTYPNGDAAQSIIVIYKNPFLSNDIDYDKVQNIYLNKPNRLGDCKSDGQGKFNISGLSDGFYLLKIGPQDRGSGFGPDYVLVEISSRKGKKKKLIIDLGQAI